MPRLAEKGNEGGALSYALEEGYRAISVAVNDVTGVSGYINRGDRVDVVATLVAYDATKKNQPVSTLIAQNLLVLETGTKWKKPTDSASDGYATVTLAATPQEALKINYAATNGKLGLVLRPVLDNAKVTTKTTHDMRGVIRKRRVLRIMPKFKVLAVVGSEEMRLALRKQFSSDDEIAVVGFAAMDTAVLGKIAGYAPHVKSCSRRKRGRRALWRSPRGSTRDYPAAPWCSSRTGWTCGW